jgi:hypothetical protein
MDDFCYCRIFTDYLLKNVHARSGSFLIAIPWLKPQAMLLILKSKIGESHFKYSPWFQPREHREEN